MTTIQTEQKLYECKVSEWWYAGLENAYIRITSPKGGSVRINKYHLDKLSDEQAAIVWKCYEDHDKKSGIVKLTLAELNLLAEAGKLAGSVTLPYQPKPKSLAQRKFEYYKKPKQTADQCGCGGTLITKDHGTWIGYFCPKCKSGGSRSSKKKYASR